MNKKKSIIILLILNILIILSGIGFSIYSYIYNVKYLVINTTIPGFILGLIVIFLGVRYLKSLNKLWKKISSPDVNFSWDNFKKLDKKRKLKLQ
jgi:hypothetical protein